MYRQVAKLLDQLEAQDVLEDGVTVPQRISALIATGRIMKMMQDLRKGNFNYGAGSAIDKYSAAFQTADDPRRGVTYPRSTTVVQFDTGRAENDGEYDDDRDFDS